MDETLMWLVKGSRAALIIPLELKDGKYGLPATLKTYFFGVLGNASGFKIPKSGDSSSKDEFLEFDTSQGEKFRIKKASKTYTLSAGALTEENGTATDTTYPEITIASGNTPMLKSGETAAAQISVLDTYEMQVNFQKTPCFIMQHIGYTPDGSVGYSTMIGKLTSDIEGKGDASKWEGITMTFTGCSVEIDPALAIASATYRPLKALTDFTFPAVANATAKLLADGQIKFIKG